mgnify:CR=1 FL=1
MRREQGLYLVELDFNPARSDYLEEHHTYAETQEIFLAYFQMLFNTEGKNDLRWITSVDLWVSVNPENKLGHHFAREVMGIVKPSVKPIL